MLKPYYVKLITAACVVFALSVAAFGANAQSATGSERTVQATGGTSPSPKSEEKGLTVEQALNVAAGLAQLASYDTVDKDGKPSKVYYKFSADLRILIAVNIDVGRAIQTRFQNASNDLIMQLSDGSGTLPDEKKGAFNVEIAKLMQAQSRAGYTRIKLADLKLDENQVPAPVLSLIIPILDR